MANNDVLKALHELWRAKLHFKLFCAGKTLSPKVKTQFNSYQTRIEWIVNDIKLNHQCSDEIREAINEEWQGDVLTVDSINEKVLQLSPSEREIIETILDAVLAGEEINVVHHKNETNAS